jgi:hypothetical protein
MTPSIISRQVHWLMQLSTIVHGEISVMLRPSSKWIAFSDVIGAGLTEPIHSRTILPNELVLEIDDDDWATVRDGTRGIVVQLIKWGGESSYYLSFSGNRSIHVHVFMDLASLRISPEVSRILASVDPGVVRSTVKAYITRQFELATGAAVDPQLTGKHLIRMEGGINEKSGKCSTAIESIPDARPEVYDPIIPEHLPSAPWNLSFLEREINVYLSLRFRTVPEYSPDAKLRPFGTDGLPNILRPVFIVGYRHYVVLSLAGWLWRHNISMEACLDVVRQLNPDDETPSKTMATVKEVYRSRQGDRVAGYRKLTEIIQEEAVHGKITAETAEAAIQGLRKIAGEGP